MSLSKKEIQAKAVCSWYLHVLFQAIKLLTSAYFWPFGNVIPMPIGTSSSHYEIWFTRSP
jgi:hypothetical protein